MSAPQITITPAGFAAIINAEHDGTAPVRITQVGVTAQAFNVDTVGTTVPAEVKRITTLGGKAVSADTLHINVRDDSQDTYTLRGFGLYLANGVLFAVYSQATPIMEKAAAATLLLATDIRFAKIDATSIEVADVDFINPPATTTQAGVARFATDLEAAGGALTTVGMTPKGVAAYVDGRFGAGAPSVFIKGLMNVATAALLRVAIGIKSAALKDEGIGNGLDADLLDGQHGEYYLKWSNLSGVPTQFNPVAHQHGMGDVTGLAEALAAKAAANHGHPISQVTGLQDAIDSRVSKTGDTMTGQLHINGQALRVSNWGGNAAAGVVYFGAANSYIQKTGGEFQFGNDVGGYTARITRGGILLTDTGNQTITGSLDVSARVTGSGGGTFANAAGSSSDGVSLLRLQETGASGEVRRMDVFLNGPANTPAAQELRFRSILVGSTVFDTPSLRSTGDVVSGQNFAAAGANVVLATTGPGAVYLRPNGIGSATGQMVLNSAGYASIADGLSVGATLSVAGLASFGGGTTVMTRGTSTNAGYIGFHTTDGVRRGYIGWNDGTNKLQYNAENGFTGHAFVGTVSATAGFDFGSSLKLKDVDGPVPYTLDDLDRIEVFVGRYKAAYNADGRKRLFHAAEGLHAVAPETVDPAAILFEGERVGALKVDQVQALQTHFLKLLRDQASAHGAAIEALRLEVAAAKVGH